MNDIATTEQPLMRVSDVAAELGVSKQRAYEMIEAREIPYVRLGQRRIRIPRAAFTAYVTVLAEQALDNLGPSTQR